MHVSTAAIVAAYKEWDFGKDGTVEDFCERYDCSRSTLYNILRRNGVPLKSQDRPDDLATRVERLERENKKLARRVEKLSKVVEVSLS